MSENDCQGEGPEFVERAEWRQRGGKDGDRNYLYFREMFPALDDQIIDQFKLGFGATILYEDMSREELGNLIYNAIAIGYVSGQQQSAAEIASLREQLTEAREIIGELMVGADIFYAELMPEMISLFEALKDAFPDNKIVSDHLGRLRKASVIEDNSTVSRARAFLKGETDNG